ncbi:reverse transcriptase domain-containing protein [Tanacetum coccineum]
MRTRNSHYPNNSPVTIPRRRNRRCAPNVVEPELRTIVEVAPMAENRTMEELLQAPTERYGEVIVIPKINADHFEIKTNLLQLVQANPFCGFERENPHTHINNFKRITSTLKFRDVPNDVIKLMMFPFSLKGAARICSNTTSGTLPSNIISNPKGEMKAITTLTGVAYDGPSIPTNPSPKSFADALLYMPKFASMFKSLISNKEKLFELSSTPLNDNCSVVLLKKLPEKLGDPGKFLVPCDFSGMVECSALADLGASINLMPLSVWKRLSSSRTYQPLRKTLELADRRFTRLKGVPPEDVFVKGGKFPFPGHFVGDIFLIEKLLNEDPFQLPSMDLKQVEVTKAKSSIEEPPELELKDLPSHLEYAYLLKRETINPQDQEKTTFTCPYGTFAYRRMPFGLCNAPGTFQRCMMAIFHDMIEKTMEVFMDDFSVFGDSFASCLSNLDKMLKRCEDTNLVLNWEKCHFMCKEGIVLGHKISKSGIEVDRAKVDVIAKLPHPTTVKGVRSFLGTKNLTADHLSRLENPHKDMLENKDINENFPLETLGVISSRSTPWFADIANFHVGNCIIKGMSSQQKKKFFKDVKHYFWDVPTFFGFMRIKSFDDVCMAKKPLISSNLVMKDPPGSIKVPISPLRKYLMSVSFGRPYIEMPML